MPQGRRRPGGPPPWRRASLLACITAVTVLGVVLCVRLFTTGETARERAPGADCSETLSPGAYGPCVRQLQLNLRRHSLDLPVDASFGPITRARVAAFQAASQLPVTGVVDATTKEAIDHQDSPIAAQADRWGPDRVEQHLRAIFPEAPETAVALIRCLSNLDPMWVRQTDEEVRTDEGEPTTWRWGLFQLTDQQIKDSGGSRRSALDPEWNIRAGRDFWERNQGFGSSTCH
ncbi:peptidoglycan-binding domain-containing protein [Streptomyces paludis]|uniref:Peptidoglycan-binding protein n=1 Tax=Streptomyces paludis TaxID=2282738 RepID=A0A345HR86_9ACTN|nr:peptidoglycan-binding protein [Streptomyces paludis]AXG79210.1 peptidoglycan-binding protein [Streptomyces paludis]